MKDYKDFEKWLESYVIDRVDDGTCMTSVAGLIQKYREDHGDLSPEIKSDYDRWFYGADIELVNLCYNVRNGKYDNKFNDKVGNKIIFDVELG